MYVITSYTMYLSWRYNTFQGISTDKNIIVHCDIYCIACSVNAINCNAFESFDSNTITFLRLQLLDYNF